MQVVTSSPASLNRTRGFTLVELLVVIGIIALLVAMLMPALSRARDQANTVACLSNHKQLALLLHMYATENKGYFPTANTCTDPSGAATGVCSSGHPYKGSMTFREYAIARGANKARMCPGPEGNYWNSISNKLGPGGSSVGSPTEDPRWITVSARICPRDDHNQPLANRIKPWPAGSGQTWRKPLNIARYRPSTKIMATVDAYVPTQMVAGIGPTPSEGGDNCGDFWNGPERLRFRHGRALRSINLSFLDGHAETWEYETLHTVPPGWGVPGKDRTLLTEDMRYLPYGTERSGPWN